MNSDSSLDIRWKQRFSNFQKALKQMRTFIDKGPLTSMESQGLIKSFEYTYELAWNTMKDFYEAQGESSIQGSKDAIRLAFRRGLIKDGENWMNMVQSRIDTAHTYNEQTATKVLSAIVTSYCALFIELEKQLISIK